jgi:ubiquinone/menaquinone biosynthesis C-methylase UbiE
MKSIGILLQFIVTIQFGQGFVTIEKTIHHLPSTRLHSSTNHQNKAKPRTGFAQTLLDLALNSPLWKLILVPEARKNIVKTAEANGIRWRESYNWIQSQDGPWNEDKSFGELTTYSSIQYPKYYTREFHAYQDGNLSWNAAMEQELASRAVGARNFPAYGSDGEDAFRGSFESAILSLGGSCPRGGVICDLGCGTGTSSRRLASMFPEASEVIGMDLSPYFISVGKRLLQLKPKGQKDGGTWVTTIEADDRLDLRVGNAESTGLEDCSVDVVNLSLVIHELPISTTLRVCKEELRILKPGGQLWISEMDFDSPAYAAQRENALLFSLLRSTEPYLDEYADGAENIRQYLTEHFANVKITAATGRHYALVATKGERKGIVELEDFRFDQNGNYRIKDTHLKVWESKN